MYISLCIDIVVHYIYPQQYLILSIGISISLCIYGGCVASTSKPRMSHELYLSLILILFLL
jgi:hypothetical protein